MKLKQLLPLFLFPVVLFCVSCGNPLDILGPRDNPDITAMEWDNLQVVYWIYTNASDTEVERVFSITNASSIAKLKSKLKVKEVSGLSIGTRNQLIFRIGSKDTWHGDFCFEDTIYLSSSKDAWRSYKFILSDLGFFNELRELCATNEQTIHPQATPLHIKLRSNLIWNYPRLLSKEDS